MVKVRLSFSQAAICGFALQAPISLAAASSSLAITPEITIYGSAIAPSSYLDSGDETAKHLNEPFVTDSALLLANFPGMHLQSAGGISNIPVFRGFRDDRLLVKTDGMSLTASCPNHMNSPLSYLDASKVDTIEVFNSTAPVSQGGDNIGGSILVNSEPSRFASSGETLITGQASAYYRSNGSATGATAEATLATDIYSVTYSGSTASAENYDAARSFKTAITTPNGNRLDGKTVGSSAFRTENHALNLAWRDQQQLVELKAGIQRTPYEGFPNQRMDMTRNDSRHLNLHYLRQMQWGDLDARIYQQNVQHSMQFGEDKQFVYGTYAGMPMESRSNTLGGHLIASRPLNTRHTLKAGGEFQRYELDDWWPPAGVCTSGMCMMSPNTFLNINNGKRNRLDVYSEMHSNWSPILTSIVGLRSSQVGTNAGNVQGYNSSMMYAGDATAFNALEHRKTDRNLDYSVLLRYKPSVRQHYEVAYAQKVRSPNLYERYTWSSMGMAAVMNNFAGDGNGYFGQINLKPEVARSISVTAEWRGHAKDGWQIRLSPYFTRIDDFIDAQRCGASLCGGTANLTTNDKFVVLQYVNQRAQLYGADLSTQITLIRSQPWGSLNLKGQASYTRGDNLSTGDNLYHIMPFNVRVNLTHEQGQWTNFVEWIASADKSRVSSVRNEIKTSGYGLLNLRARHTWKRLALDVGIDNVFNRYYEQPLGGAYVGQGMTMGINGIPWGVAVPGAGRSLFSALSFNF